MADKTPEKLDPDQGIEVLMGLMSKISDASEAGDTNALNAIINEIGEVATATGVEIPDLQENLSALQGENAKIETHSENIDAAMWVGDLARANELISGGVALDYDNIPGVEAPDLDAFDDYSEDEHYFEDVAADDPGMIEFLANLGLGGATEEPLPDLYADIAEGTPGAIGAFIASGENPNTPRGEGQHTALLAALDAPGRRAEKIERLINAGADVHVIHAHGDNVFSWAMGYHHPDTVTAETETELMLLLKRHRADPNHVTEIGAWSPLHRAIIQGDAARTTGILAAGADITQTTLPDFEPAKLAGFTPLMLAAPKPEVLRVLLKNGANPSAKDAQGRLPLDVIGAEAKAARARADTADPWTIAHADALDEACRILAAAIQG